MLKAQGSKLKGNRYGAKGRAHGEIKGFPTFRIQASVLCLPPSCLLYDIIFKFISVEVNGAWEWPAATITLGREIAVRNRSHNLISSMHQ